MALNNASNVPPTKRGLKRLDRLPDAGNISSFDNAGFEGDDRDRAHSINNEQNIMFLVEETYPQQQKMNNVDGTQPIPQRLQMPIGLAKQTNSNTKSHTKSTSSSQNVPEHESFELATRNDFSEQENRKVLGSIDAKSLNNQNVETADGDSIDSRNPQNVKTSRMTFNVNLKKFETTTTSPAETTSTATEDQDKLKLTRQTLTEDLSMNRRGSASVYSAVVAATKFSRTYSLRKEKKRPPRLLRDLSFSDADDSDTKDYGSLKKLNLPRRMGKGPLNVDTVCILESLIHELIARGKIYQVAVLDREESEILASVPSGILNKTDALGMTKSIICQPSLFRLQIGSVDYSCFKHRQDAVQGRNDDLVLVMQMTETCVVAGFARDDAPGSCNSEVHEFAKVLEEAGW